MTAAPSVRTLRRLHAATGPGPLRRLLREVADWHRRWLDRQRLAELDVRQLRDIGLTSGQAAGETGKPFWRR